MSNEKLIADQINIGHNVCTKNSNKNLLIKKLNSTYLEGGEIEMKPVT